MSYVERSKARTSSLYVVAARDSRFAIRGSRLAVRAWRLAARLLTASDYAMLDPDD
jgi:hypothetical protein